MQHASLNRRDFVTRTSQLLAGAGLLSLGASSASASDEKPVLTAACRDAMLGSSGEKDCWVALKKIGAEGFEADLSRENKLISLFHPTKKYSIVTDADVEALAADVKAAGQKITAFCMHNQFDTQPDEEVALCTRAAQAAQMLGVKAVRLDVVAQKRDTKAFLKHAIGVLKKVIKATESTGVKFGVENHGRVTNDPNFLKPLFEGVGSDRLGLTLDTGNFYWFGHPLSKVYEIYEQFAPYAIHTHCKSISYEKADREKQRTMGLEYGKRCCPIDQGDIDFGRVASILRKAGYKGDLCIENESLTRFPQPERLAILAREIAYLKKVR